MARTPEEIEEQLRELKRLKKKAESDYNKALAAGFKKHEECCPDVCNVINEAIKKLTSNITRATGIKEVTSSARIERTLSKDIIIAESQIRELNILKDELYAKHVCNCK